MPTEENIRLQWMVRTKTLHLEDREIKNSRVCSIHFEERDYAHSPGVAKRNCLRKTAVPSQCLPAPLDMKFEHNYANVISLNIKCNLLIMPVMYLQNSKVKEHATVNIRDSRLPKTPVLINSMSHLNVSDLLSISWSKCVLYIQIQI